MHQKNTYRVVLDAVLKLPWLEGLTRMEYIDHERLCCAIGAVAFGRQPQASREFNYETLSVVRQQLDFCLRDKIARANDEYPRQSPLARKHRMIKWLRERADKMDDELTRSGT